MTHAQAQGNNIESYGRGYQIGEHRTFVREALGRALADEQLQRHKKRVVSICWEGEGTRVSKAESACSLRPNKKGEKADVRNLWNNERIAYMPYKKKGAHRDESC